MNEFYHEFSIGFNYWFLLLPFQVILMIFFGASNAKLNKKTNKIMQRDKKGVITSFFTVAMDAILMAAVVAESSAGIIQVMDNHLGPEDSPVWSLVLFVFSICIFAVLMYYVFFGAAVFGKQLRLVILRKIRRKRK